MRNVVTLAMAIAVIAGTALAADDEAKADTKTKELTQIQKVSYCIGLDMGGNFKQMELDVDTDLLIKGLKAGFTDAEPMFTKEEIQEIMMQFQKEMMEKQKAMMEKQKENGIKFLAENKK